MLLTTERAAAVAPELEAAAAATLHVPAGRVDEISAALLGQAGDRPLVALGGGRVVDAAKAIAGAGAGRCAAIPTTLSGAEMTPFHRTPAGVDGARLVRPALVLADPDLMASAPPPRLAATAMNALAHALEALYTPLANPVTELAALRAAELIAAGLPGEPPDTQALALGALLAGYASGSTGIAVHHADLPDHRPHRGHAARRDQRGDAASLRPDDGEPRSGGAGRCSPARWAIRTRIRTQRPGRWPCSPLAAGTPGCPRSASPKTSSSRWPAPSSGIHCWPIPRSRRTQRS